MTDAQVQMAADTVVLGIRPLLSVWIFVLLANLFVRYREYREYKKAMEAEIEAAKLGWDRKNLNA